jgi:hypothetical protein
LVVVRYIRPFLFTRQQSTIITTAFETEVRYQALLDAMSPAERLSRSAAMFAWTREQLSRPISESLTWFGR